ncbi:MAG: hypothetical protein R6V75_06605, partial [Bacteroidales bacterium]
MTKPPHFLRDLGIPVELITTDAYQVATKPVKKAKAKKAAAKKTKPVESVDQESVAKRKPGRPKKAKEEKPVGEEKAKPAKKVKAKKAAAKKAKAVKVKEPKESKPRKQRTEKPITQEEVEAKLSIHPSLDHNTEQVLRSLFGKPKVARPKLETKLVEVIKEITNDSELVAEQITGQMKDMGLLEIGLGGRLKYKD